MVQSDFTTGVGRGAWMFHPERITHANIDAGSPKHPQDDLALVFWQPDNARTRIPLASVSLSFVFALPPPGCGKRLQAAQGTPTPLSLQTISIHPPSIFQIFSHSFCQITDFQIHASWGMASQRVSSGLSGIGIIPKDGV